ncbi:uroporphyrinogen-III C-methyltransferase, partial [Halomonas sp. AOP7-C1-8]
ISRELIAHGLPCDTPLALIENGTTTAQQTHIGTLQALPEALIAGRIKSPALLIVGSVVSLHEKLAWFKGAQTPASARHNDLHS